MSPPDTDEVELRRSDALMRTGILSSDDLAGALAVDRLHWGAAALEAAGRVRRGPLDGLARPRVLIGDYRYDHAIASSAEIP